MAKIYADLIKKGKKTIDDVPENLREEVSQGQSALSLRDYSLG